VRFPQRTRHGFDLAADWVRGAWAETDEPDGTNLQSERERLAARERAVQERADGDQYRLVAPLHGGGEDVRAEVRPVAVDADPRTPRTVAAESAPRLHVPAAANTMSAPRSIWRLAIASHFDWSMKSCEYVL
jgi:hypothetical protein